MIGNSKKEFDNRNIKNTKQRSLIFDLLYKTDTPLAAEDIYLDVRNKGNTISLSTIYRTLELFVSKGLIIKSSITSANKAMFEINRKNNKHYITCIYCKKIDVLNKCPIQDNEEKLEKLTNFEIMTHELQLYGCCPECEKEKI